MNRFLTKVHEKRDERPEVHETSLTAGPPRDSPKELPRPEDIEHGANVLMQTVLRLDRH
jgi:hypothetical protein